MSKRPATRKQPTIIDDLTQEKVDETIAEIQRNGASEDIIDAVRKALAKHVKSKSDDTVAKENPQPNPYVDDLSDGDDTEEYNEGTGEPLVKRKRFTDDDEGAGPSGITTSTRKRTKGEPRKNKEPPKKKHGKDEPHVRIITPPIRNIAPDRKTYFRIMEEVAKDAKKIQDLEKKFGHTIREAKNRIAKELFRSKNKGEEKKHKTNRISDYRGLKSWRFTNQKKFWNATSSPTIIDTIKIGTIWQTAMLVRAGTNIRMD